MEELKAKSVNTEELIKDALTPDELFLVNDGKAKASYATTLAEKAYANAQIARLNVENLLLKLCNKYKLNLENGDQIMEDGIIHRNLNNKEENGQ